jgi:DinB superfamily
MEKLQSLREHVVRMLRGGQAYDTLEAIVTDFPSNRRGFVPPGAEHSAWQILEHMRIAQSDILDFIRNEDGSYKEMRWPDDYWPASVAPPDTDAWSRSVEAFQADRKAIEALVLDEKTGPFAPFPWGDGQTVLREALLSAEHAAYHLGQIVVLRRMVDAGRDDETNRSG